MSIKAGLVGLPNVGKSTLFNALTQSNVPAENYPFCTIEPHTAITAVPDERVEKLKDIYNSQTIIDATVSFVDIAGLVKGAASGEGLGNTFLSHIREVDLIIHVIRCFEDPEIILSGESIDPLGDYDIISTELMLKDIDTVIRRKEKITHLLKSAKNKPQELKLLQEEELLLKEIENALNQTDQKKVKSLANSALLTHLSLLSGKNSLIVANLSETDIENGGKENPHLQQLISRFGSQMVIPVCAKLEAELCQLSRTDAQEVMSLFGMQHKGLDTIISRTYQNLGLITFFTCGPKEIHAWPIEKGLTVRQAAGKIHSDLERGFICAEVFNAQELFAAHSEAALKQKGKVKTEGQEYIVQDGDIINVRFNV